MGEQQDQGPYDPKRYADSEVITGEVVYQPKRTGGMPGSSRWGKREQFGDRRSYNAFVDDDTVREILDKRIRGWTLRKIAEDYGISPSTVSRWCGESVQATKRKAEDLLALRVEAAQHLEAARRAAWAVYEDAATHKTALDAIGKVETLTGAHARLMGLNAPVRVDLQVTELTEAERELQEMVNEAKAKTAADEAAVIQAASEDPDL
jgi:transcriptional regulator with XRE-family HTH domain